MVNENCCVAILVGNGDGTFQAAVNYVAGANPYYLALGDFNADGKLDLAVTSNLYGNDISILLGNGDGTFQAAAHIICGPTPLGIAGGDFDADGRRDLAVSNLGSEDVSILLGNGDGTFRTAVNYDVGVGTVPYSVAAVDLDGDGRLDLATANYSIDNITILFGNGDGTFQAPVYHCVGDQPSFVAVGDFDADGRPDIVTTNTIGNDISVLLNTEILNSRDTDGDGIGDACDNCPRRFNPGQEDADANGIGDACENNSPPIAQAGDDQSVPENALITLDGSASSDPDGDSIASYSWSQVAGNQVTLNLSDPVRPTFTAPFVPLGGANLTFQLTVNDGHLDSAADSVDITVKNVNHPPVSDAGMDQTLAEASPVTLNGSGSYDPDNDSITFGWVQTGGPVVNLIDAGTASPDFTAPFVGFAGAVVTFELTVSDGLANDTDVVNVVVDNVNHPPTADAGPDQTRNEGAPVALDGTASGDPDGDSLTYAWAQISGPTVVVSGVTGPMPTFTAPQVGPLGAVIVLRLTVDDGYGGTDDDEVAITIQDVNSPPACELARADQPVLWPPNHKMVKVGILGVTDPDNNQVAITVTGVTQDEPLNGLGDGDTAPDAVIQGSTVLIRSERAGLGNGRVYRIHFVAFDGLNGGACTGSVPVCVPHDQGRRGENQCVDDGQIVDSLGAPGARPGGCLADWDDNGQVDSHDFIAFVNDFLAGNADFDQSGVTDASDFYDFMAACFAGC